MNIGRAYLWILAGWLLICSTEASAGTRLADSTYQDWAGELSDSVLPDGSVLFEYAARTFSGRVEGAMLSLSFIPRFNCAPMFNLRVRGGENAVISEPVIELSFGKQTRVYSGYVDVEEEYVFYSIMISVEEMVSLRKLFDSSPRATINVTSKALISGRDVQAEEESPKRISADSVGSIDFSLLGSKRTTLSAQTYCAAHEPIEFQPK